MLEGTHLALQVLLFLISRLRLDNQVRRTPHRLLAVPGGSARPDVVRVGIAHLAPVLGSYVIIDAEPPP